jgi:hypothetical protein
MDVESFFSICTRIQWLVGGVKLLPPWTSCPWAASVAGPHPASAFLVEVTDWRALYFVTFSQLTSVRSLREVLSSTVFVGYKFQYILGICGLMGLGHLSVYVSCSLKVVTNVARVSLPHTGL